MNVLYLFGVGTIISLYGKMIHLFDAFQENLERKNADQDEARKIIGVFAGRVTLPDFNRRKITSGRQRRNIAPLPISPMTGSSG